MAEVSEDLAPEAEYMLETPLACPSCKKELEFLLVIRLLRTRVSFVTTLPRRGHVLVCPSCRGILSAELGGII